jgi:hypothetical protein
MRKFLSNTAIVAAAVQSLLAKGNNHPHYKEIEAELLLIDQMEPFAGKITEIMPIPDMVIHYLSKVPHYLEVEENVPCIPINVRFWMQKCPKIKSLYHAQNFLTNASAPIYGVHIQTEDDDFLHLAYIYREKGKGDRKHAKVDNRVVMRRDQGLLSDTPTENYMLERRNSTGSNLTELELKLKKNQKIKRINGDKE